jgi:hypothetical protein
MICSSLNRLPLIVRSSIAGRTLLKSGGDSGAQVMGEKNIALPPRRTYEIASGGREVAE